jgi:hypothetical protein
MNALAVRSSLFAPSFRRRLALAVRVLMPVTPVNEMTTEEFHALRSSAAPVRLQGDFPARLTHLPSSGLTL